ncbi:MAG: YbjQ family protein [Gemmataceae bacterium]
MSANLIVTTSNEIAGKPIEAYLGVVRGISVRIPSPGEGFRALGQALSGNWGAGAEMYLKLCEEARAEAFDRMVAHARKLGADAVIAMRYDANDVAQGAAEVLAYGTAVRLSQSEPEA